MEQGIGPSEAPSDWARKKPGLCRGYSKSIESSRRLRGIVDSPHHVRSHIQARNICVTIKCSMLRENSENALYSGMLISKHELRFILMWNVGQSITVTNQFILDYSTLHRMN